MIPLIPTLALALVSLTCSAFVILRTMLSVLSPRTLSRRLYPLHYCPPSSRELPPADKSYIWLALCDLAALGVFLWEAFAQRSSSAHDSTPSTTTSRLWLALTLRQTCFLIVSALILIHVRLRKSVSFGTAHWLLWVPLAFLATVSTIVAGAFAATTTTTSPGRIFRVGYLTYSLAIAVLNTVMFGCLVGTLIIIRRSLENFHKAAQGSSQQPSSDIDAVREGSIWITSTTSSRRRQEAANNASLSSTQRTRHTAASQNGTPPRFPFWPPPGAHPYASLPQTPSHDAHPFRDFEPFRRRAQSLRAAALTLSSGNSWITSSLGTHPTLSAWSFPATTTTSSSRQVASPPARERRERSPAAPAAALAVLSQTEKEKGQQPSPPVIEISVMRIVAWLAGVWVPLLFALPYIIHIDASTLQSNGSASILLAISLTVSSPILALNLLLRHPIPLPTTNIFSNAAPPRTRRPYYAPLPKQVPVTDANVKRLLGVLGPAPKLSLLPSNDHMKTPRRPSESAGAPPRRAAGLRRHSLHYAQSYRNSYDRARGTTTRHNRSVSVPFPTVTREYRLPVEDAVGSPVDLNMPRG